MGEALGYLHNTKDGPPGYADAVNVGQALVKATPERLVWGSNWPHPNETEVPDDARLFDLMARWAPDEAAQRRILVDNPARLYDFRRGIIMKRALSLLPILLASGAALVVGQESRGAQAAIPGVIAAGAHVQEVRGGFKGLEGPVAAPDGGLFFSDIPANITYKLEPNGSINVWRENTSGANGLFLARDGRLLAAEGHGPPHRRRDARQARHAAGDAVQRAAAARAE